MCRTAASGLHWWFCFFRRQLSKAGLSGCATLMTLFSNGSAKVYCALCEGAMREMPANRTDSEEFLKFLKEIHES